MTGTPAWRTSGIAALLLLPLPILGVALFQYRLFDPLPPDFWRMLVRGLMCLVLAATVAWVAVGKRRSSAVVPSAAAGLVIALTVVYAGPGGLLVAALLLLAALAMGTWIEPSADPSPWRQLLVGLALIAALVGWTLPFQVHYPVLYFLLLALLLAVRWRKLTPQLASASRAWHALAATHPIWLTLAVAATGVATLGLWLPTLNFDDNAAHLLLTDQLLAENYYRLDVSSQIWAVAPWANNVLHAVSALLSGEEARVPVAALWLAVGVAGAYRLARALDASPATAIAAAAVYASHPLTAYYGSTMQVDGAVAGVLMHFACELVRDRGRLLAPISLGALLGLLAGLKSSNAAYVLLPLAWLLIHAWRNHVMARLMVVVLAAAVIGGASYFYAIAITGNPVFPLFNSIFKSPYFPLTDFHDYRWDSGFGWTALWDLTFDTGRFGETYAGSAGIALLALLPGVAVEIIRRGTGRWVALWLLAAGALMFWQIQYFRYVFPAIAIVSTVGVVGLGRSLDTRVLALVVAAIVVVNALLVPNLTWMTVSDPWKTLVSERSSGATTVQRAYTAPRVLLDRLHLMAPKACVLAVDEPVVAGFDGRVNAISNYDPRLSEAYAWAEVDASGHRWREILHVVGPSHIIVRSPGTWALTLALTAMDYVPIDSEATLQVWAHRDPNQRSCTRDFQRRRDEAHRHFHPDDGPH